MDPRKYNISSFDGEKWNHLASISNDVITVTNTQMPRIVYQMNDVIIKEIVRLQGTSEEPRFAKKSEIVKQKTSERELEFLMLGIIRCRQCTTYLIIQYSPDTDKVRILAYGADEILHHGTMGTSLKSIKNERITQEISEFLQKRLNHPIQMNDRILKKLKKNKYVLFTK